MSDIIEIYLDYIDDDGYVHRYDYENKRYYNTRTCLRGPAGNPGRPGRDGDSWSLKEVDGTYYWFKNGVNTGIPAQTGGGGTPVDLAKVAKTGDYNDLKNKPTIPTALSQLSEDSTHRVVSDAEKTTWNNKSNFSGSYNDLKDKPTIPVVPTNVSAFNNDAGYLTEHQDISGKEDTTTIIPVDSDTMLVAKAGKYYRVDITTNFFTVVLPTMRDTSTIKTVVLYLTTGNNPSITISTNDARSVYFQDGFEIEADSTYEINCLFNGVAWIVAAVKINVE